MQKRLQYLLFLGLLVLNTSSFAQLVSGNVFIKGNYLEGGSMPNGALGSAVAAPAGYHPHNSGSVYGCSTSSPNFLAHVYDWGHDGWTTGTPAYMGDYTLPGSPWEGWGVEVAGSRGFAYYTSCSFTGGLTGSWTSHAVVPGTLGSYWSSVGSRAIGYWDGSFASGALAIHQEYSIDSLGNNINFTVKLKNTTGSPLTGVHYMRSCDPDNNQSWSGGSFSTTNTIVYQDDYYHRVLVKATSTGSASATGTPPTSLSLGTKDCRAKCFIFSSWPMSTSTSLAAAWLGTATGLGSTWYIPENTVTSDIAIALVYNVGVIPAYDSTIISFAYIYDGTVGVDSAFPEPKLSVNGVHYDSLASITACGTIPLNILYGSDKSWTKGEWRWDPAIGLASDTGVVNSVNTADLSGTTVYTITGSNTWMGSCVEKQFILTVNPLYTPPPTPHDTTFCLGSPGGPLTAGGTGSLIWYTTATGGTGSSTAPTPSTATLGVDTFWVAQNIAGCVSARVPLLVTIEPPPGITLSNNSPLCPGDSLKIFLTDTLGVTTLTYSWTGPGGYTSTSRNPIIPNCVFADSGEYTVVVDNNGCSTYPTTTSVLVHSTPPSPAFINPTYCQYLPTVALSATGTNIMWFTSAIGGFGSTTAPTPSSSTPGTFTWYVTQTINGCESARYPVTATINPKPLPPTVINTPGGYCPGAPFNPYTVVSGTNIRWYAASTGGTGTTTEPVVNTNIPGTYTYWVSQTVLGCEGDRSPVTVTVFDSVNARFNYMTRFGCPSDTVIFANSSYGATGYQWEFGDGTNSISPNPTHVYVGRGVYTVKLYARSANCLDSMIQIIDLRHPDSAGFTLTPAIVCQNNPVTFTNTSIGTTPSYLWNFGDGTTSVAVNPTHSYQNTGSYRIMMVQTDFVPCSDTAYGYVTVDSQTIMDLKLSDTVLCRGTYVTMSSTYTNIGYTGVVWNMGNGDSLKNINPVVYAYPNPGNYTISVTSRYRVCNEVSVTRNIAVIDQPEINLGPDTSICIGSEAITLTDHLNTGNPNASWTWSTGSHSSSIRVDGAGYYTAVVKIGGCAASDTVWVQNSCYVIIPNSFTPNKDGVNDYFNPRDYFQRGLSTFGMTIYNRWGQVIFETKSLEGRGWDGAFNGTPQPEGVYVYVIDATFADGQKVHKVGNLTLIK